jgi:hypothetical protein
MVLALAFPGSIVNLYSISSGKLASVGTPLEHCSLPFQHSSTKPDISSGESLLAIRKLNPARQGHYNQAGRREPAAYSKRKLPGQNQTPPHCPANHFTGLSRLQYRRSIIYRGYSALMTNVFLISHLHSARIVSSSRPRNFYG